jgi:hypothetical protein
MLLCCVYRYVERAKKKATSELAKNSQAADSIDSVLQQLEACLARAAGPQPAAPAPAAAATGAAAADSSSQQQQQQGEPAALQDCQQLVGVVDDLRRQLLRQAQVRRLVDGLVVMSAAAAGV